MSTSDQPSQVYLSAAPYLLSDLPSEEALLAAGQTLIASLDANPSAWKKGKTYKKGSVQSFSRSKGPKDIAPWYARRSVHTKEEGSFEEFWIGLGTNKGVHESEFVSDLRRATAIRTLSPNLTLWSLYYRLPPPILPRVFNELQLIVRNDSVPSQRSFLVVSLPIDVRPDAELKQAAETGVWGRYASVEIVKELEDGTIAWDMAVTSDSGGWVPVWMTNLGVAPGIAKDIPSFLGWIQSHRQAKSNTK